MAANQQVSSNVYGRYHGAVNAKELRSQKQHGHGGMHSADGKEGSKLNLQIYDGFDKQVKPYGGNTGPHQPRGETRLREEIRETDGKHSEASKYGYNRRLDNYDFSGRNSRYGNMERFTRPKSSNGFNGMYEGFQGAAQSFKLTQVTVTYSSVFSGIHLGGLKQGSEAHQNFLDAVRGVIEKPGEQSYKALTDAMVKLMDPQFTPAVSGGSVQLNVRGVNGASMVKLTMEITPAPVKTLEEAREDLKNAYSSKRNGEKDIEGVRAEAYTNYIRALSEKFKQDGVISHTNHTPTTPVFKSSVIYIAKITQVSVTSLREIKKPEFKDNYFHGRPDLKNQHGFWSGFRQNSKSYVDLIRQDSKKTRSDKDLETGKHVKAKHGYPRFSEEKDGIPGHRRHNNDQTDKAG